MDINNEEALRQIATEFDDPVRKGASHSPGKLLSLAEHGVENFEIVVKEEKPGGG